MHLKYFKTQVQVVAKQLRCNETLALISVDFIHKSGCNNVVLDVLSKPKEFQAMSTIQALSLMYKSEGNLEQWIR